MNDRKPEVAQSTLYEHRTRLRRFTEWAEERGLDSMADMTRQIAQKYKAHRADEVAPTTLEHEMRTFRLFVRFCEDFGCCPEGVASHIRVPSAPKGRRSRDEKLDAERATRLIEWLRTYQYASFRHTLFAVAWKLGARISGIRALDVDDFEPEHPTTPYVEFVHRPEEGTPLKNGWKSERRVAVDENLAGVLRDWVGGQRPDVTDEHDRAPLLATKQGRPAKTTVQRNIYAMTRPCWTEGDCPHERELESCEATGDYNNASKCPSSRSPHTLRRGRATANANDGMDEQMVCDMMDMSPEVYREHYRRQTEDDKLRMQAEFMDGR